MPSGVLPARMVFLLLWGNVALATVPRLLPGPLRPVPVAHLCWILSIVVVALALRRPGGLPGAERRAVAAGMIAGLVIGFATGGLTTQSGLIGAAIVTLVSLGLEGPVALVMITIIALGFRGRVIGPGTDPAPPPPWAQGPADGRPYNPSAQLDPADSAERVFAIDYGRSLWRGDSLPPSDQRRLTLANGETLGPLARVWAEPNAYLNDPVDLLPAELGRGRAGRIVARIWVDPVEPAGYEPLGLPPGVSWLWIDSLETREGTLRGAIIPENGAPVRIRRLRWIRSAPSRFGTQPDWINHSVARWIYGSGGESLAVSCAMLAECRLEPAR
ncbi:MAG TPA: hypothetical protein VFU23_03165 [Gemmatimonadales bacterium]|nr:hypothetical protein [Gemmatimonadales bacterium]